MKTINKYLCAIAFLLGLVSCDSFLTTPPLDQISEDQWWKDKSQTEMMVKGAYDYIYDTEEVAYRDCFSDNGMRRSSAQTEIGNGTYTTQNSAVKDEWKYASIAKLNYILEGLEKARDKITEAEYLRFSAEVRFIRAFVYYDMIFYFGDVPLITKTLTVAESRETSRQPRQEVLDFVLSELEDFVLPNINALEIKESGRVNEQTVNAYLSRIYLYEKDYG